MDYKVVKSRITNLVNSNEIVFQNTCLGIIKKAEENMREKTVLSFLDSLIQVAGDNPKYGLGLSLVARDLKENISEIESLKSYHENLFISGYNIQSLKNKNEREIMVIEGAVLFSSTSS